MDDEIGNDVRDKPVDRRLVGEIADGGRIGRMAAAFARSHQHDAKGVRIGRRERGGDMGANESAAARQQDTFKGRRHAVAPFAGQTSCFSLSKSASTISRIIWSSVISGFQPRTSRALLE